MPFEMVVCGGSQNVLGSFTSGCKCTIPNQGFMWLIYLSLPPLLCGYCST